MGMIVNVLNTAQVVNDYPFRKIKEFLKNMGHTLILTWEFFTEDKLYDGKIEFVLE
jgi:hypothetical protein